MSKPRIVNRNIKHSPFESPQGAPRYSHKGGNNEEDLFQNGQRRLGDLLCLITVWKRNPVRVNGGKRYHTGTTKKDLMKEISPFECQWRVAYVVSDTNSKLNSGIVDVK